MLYYLWAVVPAYIALSLLIGLVSTMMHLASFHSGGFRLKAMAQHIGVMALLWPLPLVELIYRWWFTKPEDSVPLARYDERVKEVHLLTEALELFKRRQEVFEDYVRCHGGEVDLQNILKITQDHVDENFHILPPRGGKGHPIGWTRGHYWGEGAPATDVTTVRFGPNKEE